MDQQLPINQVADRVFYCPPSMVKAASLARSEILVPAYVKNFAETGVNSNTVILFFKRNSVKP